MKLHSQLMWLPHRYSLTTRGKVEQSKLFTLAGPISQPLRMPRRHQSWDSGGPWITGYSLNLIAHTNPLPTHCHVHWCPVTFSQTTPCNSGFIHTNHFVLGPTVSPPIDSSYSPHRRNFLSWTLQWPNCINFGTTLFYVSNHESQSGKTFLLLLLMTETSTEAEYSDDGLLYSGLHLPMWSHSVLGRRPIIKTLRQLPK